ncbi:hypothetical protein PINS_up003350 [Pythium insidiosum]|nr:hypothetical protein PINS_up003350 [Pythium insidiosum]
MQLSSFWFGAVWSGVFLAHVTYVVGYAFEARWYLTAVQDGAKLAYLMRLHSLSDDFHAGIDVAVVTTSTVIALWHMLALTRMAFASMRARTLVFVFQSKPRRTASSIKKCRRRCHGYGLFLPLHVLWRVFFDIDGAYFELGTDFRESIEIATQINVTYRLSHFVEQSQVCHFATFALVLNCWSTPVLRSMWRRHPEKSRFARLLVGVLLAIIFTIGLPLMVFKLYYGLLVGSRDSLFRPRSVVAIGHLLQQILTIRWLDLISTRFAAFMAILGIETIKRRARRRSLSVKRLSLTGPVIPGPVQRSGRSTAALAVWRRGPRLTNALFLLTGVVLLVVHAHATTRSSPMWSSVNQGVTCDLEVRPWFAAVAHCSVLILSCDRLGIRGDQKEWTSVFTTTTVDSSLEHLDAIAITACSALTVPTELRRCRRLMHLELFNDTLAQWGADAALTATDHPRFTYLSMIQVRNMTALPRGVQAESFPAITIDIGETDLAVIPSDIAMKWTRRLEYMVIERCNLTDVSSALWELRYRRLSLAGNRLSMVPPELFQNRSVRSLSLSGNPITQLPTSDAVHTWSARSIELVETNVSSLPTWVLAAAAAPGATRPFVEAAGSPLCTSASRSGIESSSVVNCAFTRMQDLTTWIPFTLLRNGVTPE